jgi:hypothetical protein
MPTHRRFRRQRGGAARLPRGEGRPPIRRPNVLQVYDVDTLTVEQLKQKHLTVIGHGVKHIRKFNVDGYQTKFLLRDLDHADNPIRVLERILDDMMADATQNATEAGYEVTDIGIP